MRRAILILLALTGCVSRPGALPIAAAPVFVPQSFFAGRTEGSGTLKIMLRPRQPVTVHGRGRVGPDGVLTLDQTVVEANRPPTERTWRFQPVAAGRYTGTLSDAAGPVSGEVTGNRLHLYFRMRGGIVADQLLDLAADGRSARNLMTFRKFGVVVATLDETIRKL